MSAVVDLRAGEGVAVAALADLPVGEGRAFAVPDPYDPADSVGAGGGGLLQVAVFRHRDGRLSAVDAVCPHAGGPLADGQVDACVVVCPLHLSAWELATGASRSGQAPVRVHAAAAGEDGVVRVVVGPPAGPPVG